MEHGELSRQWGTSDNDNAAIQHLRECIVDGKPWHIALLEAIGLWTCPEENVNGQRYLYLIDGEAFNWLLLAERLCQEVMDAIPERELLELLFYGRLPEAVPVDKFKGFIGEAKHHAYLNYLYGVTIEKFVLLAIDEEIQKETQSHIFSAKEWAYADCYRRLYGLDQESLLRLFRKEKHYHHSKAITLDQLEEFTYWLFKYRLKNCDKERVASDTKKGLEYLKRQKLTKAISINQEKFSYSIDHTP